MLLLDIALTFILHLLRNNAAQVRSKDTQAKTASQYLICSMRENMTILKPEIKQAILDSKMLKIALFELFSITQTRTLKTWVEDNDPRLTTLDALKVIAAYTGVETEQLTCEVAKMTAVI